MEEIAEGVIPRHRGRKRTIVPVVLRPEVAAALKQLSYDLDRNQATLIREGVDWVLAKYQKT